MTSEDIAPEPQSPRTMNHNEPLLTQFLRENQAQCPKCKYNLRDLTGTNCPECGASLILRVGLEDPQLGPYVLALTSLSLGLGYSLPVTMIFLIHGAIDEIFRDIGRIMVLYILPISLVSFILMLAFKTRFRMLPYQRQKIISGFTLFTILSMIFFSIMTFT